MNKHDKTVLKQFLGDEGMTLIAEHGRLVEELNVLGPDTDEYDRVNKQRERIAKDIIEIAEFRCEQKKSRTDIAKTVMIGGTFLVSTFYESLRPVFSRSWNSLSGLLSRQLGRS